MSYSFFERNRVEILLRNKIRFFSYVNYDREEILFSFLHIHHEEWAKNKMSRSRRKFKVKFLNETFDKNTDHKRIIYYVNERISCYVEIIMRHSYRNKHHENIWDFFHLRKKRRIESRHYSRLTYYRNQIHVTRIFSFSKDKSCDVLKSILD